MTIYIYELIGQLIVRERDAIDFTAMSTTDRHELEKLFSMVSRDTVQTDLAVVR